MFFSIINLCESLTDVTRNTLFNVSNQCYINGVPLWGQREKLVDRRTVRW